MKAQKIYSGVKRFFILFCLFVLWMARLSAMPNAADDNKNSEERQKAMEVFDILDETGKYTDNLTIADLNNLPMGLSRTTGNVEYCVAISGYRHRGDYAELTVYGRVVIPGEEDKTLFFGAQGIKFAYSGQFLDEAVLMLLGDITIPIHGNQASLILRGGFDKSTGTGLDLTYMAINCDGFKELGITADVVFPETLIRKVDSGGKPVEGINGRVSGSFHTIVSDWEDILVSLTLPRFEIVGLNGFIFNIEQAVFDFSYLRNAPATVFPKNYASKYLIPGQHDSWQGVYISTLSVTLPEQFARKDRAERISFSAENMLVDNNGISGLFSAENVLSINQGSASGWRFSVSSFSLELETSQLVGARFAGEIGLPVSEKANLEYEGIISHGSEYSLTVKPVNSLSFDLWAATATIYSNSYITLNVENGRFRPEAMLNGSLNINAGKNSASGKGVAVLKGVEFSKLHITTESPYISVQSIGYNGSVKLGGFPLSVDNIKFTASGGEAKLGFSAKLSLIGDKSPIAAETRINIIGTTSSSIWKYKTVEVSDIALDAEIAEVFKLQGALSILDNDPVYGNGFAGAIKLTLKAVMQLDVSVRAMFGNKEENNTSFRYWFVDGSAKFAPGILIPPAVRINGFGGGAYSGMRPQEKTAGSSGLASMPAGTGAVYVPDNNYGLGFKAAVMFNVLKDELIDGEASFEIAFNKSGGLNFIGFYGQVKFLGQLPLVGKIEESVGKKFNSIAKKEQAYLSNKGVAGLNSLANMKQSNPNKAAETVFEPTEKPGTSGLLATAGIQYDFTNKSLHASFDIYVNAAKGLLRGTGTDNKAGWVVFHSDPKKWYLHAGTPNNRIGVEVNLLGLAKVRTTSYFMVGHDIPNSPPPPAHVANILGKDVKSLDYMRDLNALGNGTGIAFGSAFEVSTGDLTFLIFYANFGAGLGFDIMLKQYNAYCKGNPKEKIGIDGWYANGQSYAYLQGELGIKVNIKIVFVRINKKIAIIKGAAAMLLQAKLPNPSWFYGVMGLRYSVLGGLIKGSTQFELTLGQKCEFVTDKTLKIDEIISEMTPMDGSTDVDLLVRPQVMFKMPVDKSFSITDINNAASTYRVRFLDYSITYNGKTISGKPEWNTNKDMLTFVPNEMLPPTSKLKARVNVTFEEYRNSKWVTIQNSWMETTFTTGKAPDHIYDANIKYTYPVIGQRYFHPGETKQAYVQLIKDQAYLFGPEMKHEIRISAGNKVTTTSLTYDAAGKCVKFTMPELDLNTKYTLEILSYPTVQKDAVITRLKYEFGTSGFNTFKDKINGVNKTTPRWLDSYYTATSLYHEINGSEPFESVELTGSRYTDNKTLVSVSATLTDDYYLSKIKPLLYEKYPLELYEGSLLRPSKVTRGITNRDVSKLGVPPVKAISLLPEYIIEVQRGILTNNVKKLFPYRYNLPEIYYNDFLDLRNKVAKALVISKNKYQYLLNATFPQVLPGKYEIELRYVFPNGSTGTSGKFTYSYK